jgi:hypothetical protein
VRGLQQALEAAVLHVNKLRVLHMDASTPPTVEDPAPEQEKEPEGPADAGMKPPIEKVAPAERGDDGKQRSEDAVTPPDPCVDPPKEAEPELQKSLKKNPPFDLSFPLMLTKEIIDQLLPFDHATESIPNLYV